MLMFQPWGFPSLLGLVSASVVSWYGMWVAAITTTTSFVTGFVQKVNEEILDQHPEKAILNTALRAQALGDRTKAFLKRRWTVKEWLLLGGAVAAMVLAWDRYNRAADKIRYVEADASEHKRRQAAKAKRQLQHQWDSFKRVVYLLGFVGINSIASMKDLSLILHEFCSMYRDSKITAEVVGLLGDTASLFTGFVWPEDDDEDIDYVPRRRVQMDRGDSGLVPPPRIDDDEPATESVGSSSASAVQYAGRTERVGRLHEQMAELTSSPQGSVQLQAIEREYNKGVRQLASPLAGIGYEPAMERGASFRRSIGRFFGAIFGWPKRVYSKWYEASLSAKVLSILSIGAVAAGLYYVVRSKPTRRFFRTQTGRRIESFEVSEVEFEDDETASKSVGKTLESGVLYEGDDASDVSYGWVVEGEGANKRSGKQYKRTVYRRVAARSHGKGRDDHSTLTSPTSTTGSTSDSNVTGMDSATGKRRRYDDEEEYRGMTSQQAADKARENRANRPAPIVGGRAQRSAEQLRPGHAILRPIVTYPIRYADKNNQTPDVPASVDRWTTAAAFFDRIEVPRHGPAGAVNCYITIDGKEHRLDEFTIMRSMPDMLWAVPPKGAKLKVNSGRDFHAPVKGRTAVLYYNRRGEARQSVGVVGDKKYLGAKNEIEVYEFDGSTEEGACGGVYVDAVDGAVIGFHGLGSRANALPEFYPVNDAFKAEASGQIRLPGYDFRSDSQYTDTYHAHVDGYGPAPADRVLESTTPPASEAHSSTDMQCKVCKKMKPSASFSKNQRKAKSDERSCKECAAKSAPMHPVADVKSMSDDELKAELARREREKAESKNAKGGQ